MTDSTKAGLREDIARALIAKQFGIDGLLMFDIPGEATPDQRAYLVDRVERARAEASAIISGPLAPLLAAAEAVVIYDGDDAKPPITDLLCRLEAEISRARASGIPVNLEGEK